MTPILQLLEWAAAQATPWNVFNLAARKLEYFAAGGAVEDRDVTDPSGLTPTDGQAWLIATGAIGDWAGKDDQIAFYLNTGFVYFTPTDGMQVYVKDEDVRVIYDGTTWASPVESSGSQIESLIIACSDETTALAAGAAKVTLRMPYAFDVTEVRASLTTAQVSGSILTVDINEGGVSILSTKLTIDNTEKTSTTASAPPVISDAALADDAEVTIDIDQVGDGTAKGLKVYLIGRRA